MKKAEELKTDKKMKYRKMTSIEATVTVQKDALVAVRETKLYNNSALHKAFRNSENRSIDILLGYMAKIPKNSSKSF